MLRKIVKNIPIMLFVSWVSFISGAFADDGPMYELVVSSGGIERKNSLVSFYVPTEILPGSYYLQDEREVQTVMQVDRHNTGWLILDELPRCENRTYTFSSADTLAHLNGGVGVKTDRLRIIFHDTDDEIVSYYYRERPLPEGIDTVYVRAGYLHPVRTPNGVIVTQDFAEVHPHHHGIWTAWTNVEFDGRETDFWNVGKELGTVVFESLDETWEGYVQSGLRARHRYVDITTGDSITALREQWLVYVYNIGDDFRIFDIEIIQSANAGQPITMPEYEYGGIGFRGHENWEGEDNAYFLTSEGKTRANGHGTRGRWCYISGVTDGQQAGIAILSHPGNFRHPQPMYIHSHRTFFNYAVVQLGEIRIEPGSPYQMRYRFITFDGEPASDTIDRLWYDYAYPPSISITRINED